LACRLVRLSIVTNPFYLAVGPLIGLTMLSWASGPGQSPLKLIPLLPHPLSAAPVLRVAHKNFSLSHHKHRSARHASRTAGRMPAFFSLHNQLLLHSRVPRGLCHAQPARHYLDTITAGPCFPTFYLYFHSQQFAVFIHYPLFTPFLSYPKLEL